MCSALSVLTKAHPWWMLRRKKKKNVRNVLWYIFIIFNYFSTGAKGAVESIFDGLSTSVFCSLYTLLPPFFYVFCSIISDSGDKVKTLHGHVFLPLFVHFVLVSIFMVERAFCFVVCLCREDVKCITFCHCCIALSDSSVWHVQCTELKALTWP